MGRKGYVGDLGRKSKSAEAIASGEAGETIMPCQRWKCAGSRAAKMVVRRRAVEEWPEAPEKFRASYNQSALSTKESAPARTASSAGRSTSSRIHDLAVLGEDPEDR
jgi:hypothetical protein